MNVSLAAQTLSSSVAKGNDFLWDEIALPGFWRKWSYNWFHTVDMAFVMMTSRNPLATGFNVAPVALENLPEWRKKCYFGILCSALILCYQYQKISWHEMTSHSNLHLHTNCNKITMNFCSRKLGGDMGATTNLRYCSPVCPKRIIIWNSTESSNTGNCPHFDDALCDWIGLLDLSRKIKQNTPVTNLPDLVDPEMVNSWQIADPNGQGMSKWVRDMCCITQLGTFWESCFPSFSAQTVGLCCCWIPRTQTMYMHTHYNHDSHALNKQVELLFHH